MGWWKKIKKAARKVVGADDNNKPKMPVPDAALGPTGDVAKRATTGGGVDRRRARAARGRDSTIITSRSEIGSRTLLG